MILFVCWLELVVDFDENNKNSLPRLKPKGTPPVLTPRIKAFRLLLALNPCGCGRFPPASNAASKKQKKVKHSFFDFTIKSNCPLFSVFCLSCVGGRKPTAALTDKTRGESSTFWLGFCTLRRAAGPHRTSGFDCFCLIQPTSINYSGRTEIRPEKLFYSYFNLGIPGICGILPIMAFIFEPVIIFIILRVWSNCLTRRFTS